MKPKSKITWQIGVAALVVMLAVSAMLVAVPAGVVQASSTTAITSHDEQAPTGDAGEGLRVGTLEKALKRERQVHENLTALLVKADKSAIRLEEAITTGQANDRDVSELQDALEELTTQITAARAAHAQVADLLKNPKGFNHDGQVVDRQVALDTIKQIHLVQQDIRQLLGNSLRDTMQAIRDYCQENKPD
jgi:hypothetical protein